MGTMGAKNGGKANEGKANEGKAKEAGKAVTAGQEAKKRKAELVSAVLEKIEKKIEDANWTPSVSDLVRLYELEKKLQEEEQPKEIKVSWVEGAEKESESER